MAGCAAGQRLPAVEACVDMERIKLHTVAAAAGTLGRDNRGAAAKKAIEHDIATRRAVKDGIGDHRHRLHCRVQRQQIALGATAGEGVNPRIAPDVGPVAPEARRKLSRSRATGSRSGKSSRAASYARTARMDRLPGLPPWKLRTTLRRSCRSGTQIICGARSRYRTGRPRPSSRSWQGVNAGSYMTPRWREMDSNFRFRAR